MKDDNQKFLDKFKDQITTLGKKGILDSNNNNDSKYHNNHNSKGRKGSAFLKPINKDFHFPLFFVLSYINLQAVLDSSHEIVNRHRG